MRDDEPFQHAKSYTLTQVAVIMLAGYLVVLAFDTEGLHKWAESLPLGAVRDRVMAVTGAFHTFANRVALTRPRQVVAKTFRGAAGLEIEQGVAADERSAEVTDDPEPPMPPEPLVDIAALRAQLKEELQTQLVAEIRKTIAAEFSRRSQLHPTVPPLRLATAGRDQLREPKVALPQPAVKPKPIATVSRLPEPSEPPQPPSPKKDVKRRRIMLLGDSIMGGIAPMVKKALKQYPDAPVPVIHSKVSSGLTRPKRYDWPKAARALFAKEDVDDIIVHFGTNDFFSIRLNGKMVRWKQKAWDAAYTHLIHHMLDVLYQEKRHVYWLEIPPMRKAWLHTGAQDECPVQSRGRTTGVRNICADESDCRKGGNGYLYHLSHHEWPEKADPG